MADANGQVITGRVGTVKIGGVAIEVKDWKATLKNKVASVATSTTFGWKTTALGICEWDVSFTAILPYGLLTNISSFASVATLGALVAFVGTSNGTGGVSGNVRIESIEESVPIDGGDLSIPIHAVGDGAPTLA